MWLLVSSMLWIVLSHANVLACDENCQQVLVEKFETTLKKQLDPIKSELEEVNNRVTYLGETLFDAHANNLREVVEENHNSSQKEIINTLQSAIADGHYSSQEVIETIKKIKEILNTSKEEIKTEIDVVSRGVTGNTEVIKDILNITKDEIKPEITDISNATIVPHGFERFNERLIRRTLSSDPKSVYDDAMSFCCRFEAKPLIPRTGEDYQLYKDVRNSLTIFGYMWLPANDRQQEGQLRWYNGEVATGISLWDWLRDEELAANTGERDCLWYGPAHRSRPRVVFQKCDYHSYPPICVKM